MICKHKHPLHRCRMCKLIELHHLIPGLSKDVIRLIVGMIEPTGKLIKMYYNSDHMEDEWEEESYLSFSKCFENNGKIRFNFVGSEEDIVDFCSDSVISMEIINWIIIVNQMMSKENLEYVTESK